MDYRTYAPNENLNAFVKYHWTLDASKEKGLVKQRIVPDGCLEMIFHYGDLFRQYLEDGSSFIQPRCFVFGQITRPLEIEPTGETGVFSTCFYPHGFYPFATVPMNEMENTAVPLAELFGEEGLLLEAAVLHSRSHEERIKRVEEFLLQRLVSQESAERVVRSSIDVITSLNGQLSINELSAQLKIHRRQLERKFSTVTGLTPKQLSKMIRVQTALKKLTKNDYSSLTDIAYEGDYYDQAHFIKDFKEFTGISPKEFYADQLKMSSLFIGDQ